MMQQSQALNRLDKYGAVLRERLASHRYVENFLAGWHDQIDALRNDDPFERIEIGGCLLARRRHMEVRGNGAGRLRQVPLDALRHQYAMPCDMKDARQF